MGNYFLSFSLDEDQQVIDVPVHITLHIYSGKQNPSWILSLEDVNYMINEFNMLPSKDHRSYLGYSGFTLNNLYYIGNRYHINAHSNTDLEKWLLSTMPEHLKTKYIETQLHSPDTLSKNRRHSTDN